MENPSLPVIYKTKLITLPKKEKYKSFRASHYVKDCSDNAWFAKTIFRGFRDQINAAAGLMNKLGYKHIFKLNPTTTPDIFELRIPYPAHDNGENIVELILKEFPVLKMTSFFNSMYESYVVLSEPGYGYLTDARFICFLDPKSEAYFIEDYEPTDTFRVKITYVSSGTSNKTDYSFPFARRWRQFNYLKQDGDNYYAVSEIILPEGIENLDDYAYPESGSLEKLVLPESIMMIGEKAFSGCSKNFRLFIPDQNDRKMWNGTCCPDTIDFLGSAFVISGFDEKTEAELSQLISDNGGFLLQNLSDKTDYLVINQYTDGDTGKSWGVFDNRSFTFSTLKGVRIITDVCLRNAEEQNSEPVKLFLPVLDQLKKMYPDPSKRKTTIRGILDEDKNMAKYLHWLEEKSQEVYGMDAESYLCKEGVLKEKQKSLNAYSHEEAGKAIEDLLNTITALYQDREEHPASIRQIKQEHPELDFRIIDKYFEKIYQMTLPLWLAEAGVLEKETNEEQFGEPRVDYKKLLHDLQQKYQDPSERKATVKELIDDNPELEKAIKVLQRKSVKIYDQTFSLLLTKLEILKD